MDIQPRYDDICALYGGGGCCHSREAEAHRYASGLQNLAIVARQ